MLCGGLIASGITVVPARLGPNRRLRLVHLQGLRPSADLLTS